MAVEAISEREEITALRALLREALIEIRYRQITHPTSSASDLLERGAVALKISPRDLTA
jgi:hypothetical protein